jgi:hypothetical protein
VLKNSRGIQPAGTVAKVVEPLRLYAKLLDGYRAQSIGNRHHGGPTFARCCQVSAESEQRQHVLNGFRGAAHLVGLRTLVTHLRGRGAGQ